LCVSLGLFVFPIQDLPTATSLYIGGVGLFISVYGAFMFSRIFRERDWRVLTFSDGLMQIKSGAQMIIRWDDITSVWQSITVVKRYGVITVSTTHLYTVQRANGEVLYLNDQLKNVEALGTTIQNEVTRRLLPRAVDTYNSGGVVTFGKLTVSKEGLSNGKETIPWSQVQKVSIKSGTITVRKEGKLFNWSNVTVAETPNVFVFLSLVDQIVGIKK
jgi:hypothetical protein